MVPKPVNSKKLIEDKRKEYLEVWKKLFEDIDPSIKVFLWHENDFMEELEKSGLKDIPFHHETQKHILVLFTDSKIINLRYLCGRDDNEMFSDVDIEGDDMYQNEDYDCFPQSETWEKWLNDIRSRVEFFRKRIPEPPEKSAKL